MQKPNKRWNPARHNQLTAFLKKHRVPFVDLMDSVRIGKYDADRTSYMFVYWDKGSIWINEYTNITPMKWRKTQDWKEMLADVRKYVEDCC